MSSELADISPIATRTQAILEAFEELQKLSSDHARDARDADTLNGDLDDRLSRFRLWAGNLGAYHPKEDARSLDSRLRDAPEVAERILELLSELLDLFQDGEWSCFMCAFTIYLCSLIILFVKSRT